MATLLKFGPKKMAQVIERILISGLVPILKGSPGLGKSDLFRATAQKYNLKVIDLRLSQLTPEDLHGLPMRSVDGKKAVFAPFDHFPLEGDELEINPATGKTYDGWLVFLDELTSATKAVQAAAYKLILDRMVGNHNLHERVMLAAAGNLITDNAVVIGQSTALQSRLVHLEISFSFEDWMEWAQQAGVDFRVRGYLGFKQSAAYDFDPKHKNETFACPRTWHFVSRYLDTRPGELDELDQMAISGMVTEGYATEFMAFTEIATKVPTIEQIIADPDGTVVPKDLSFRHFLTVALGDKVDDSNFKPVMTYMNRMPEEFQVIFMRGVSAQHPKLRTHPVYVANISKLMRFTMGGN